MQVERDHPIVERAKWLSAKKGQLFTWRQDGSLGEAIEEFRADLEEGEVLDLSGLDLSGADLRRINLSGTRIIDTILESADLSGSDICNTYFSGTNLKGAKLSDSMIHEAQFVNCELEDCDFSESTLVDCKFHDCTCKRMNLKESDLGGTHFEDSDLMYVDFSTAGDLGSIAVADCKIELHSLLIIQEAQHDACEVVDNG